MSGVSFDLYSKFESGARTLSHIRLERVLESLKGTLMVAPFLMNEPPVDDSYPNDVTAENGVSLSQVLASLNELNIELPNVLISDNIVLDTIATLEMYLKGIFGKRDMNRGKYQCEERYIHYDKKENGDKLSIEPKTFSLEMIVIEICRKSCTLDEYHKVPELINDLLNE